MESVIPLLDETQRLIRIEFADRFIIETLKPFEITIGLGSDEYEIFITKIEKSSATLLTLLVVILTN
jgi:hypothetical protein